VGANRAGLPAPADEAARFGCPVLALWGGADEGIGPEAVATFDQAMDRAGAQHTTVIYPGAPHSFFDRRSGEHAAASADAWRQMLTFMGVASAS
jgi:carboxymethylenebutenolidase